MASAASGAPLTLLAAGGGLAAVVGTDGRLHVHAGDGRPARHFSEKAHLSSTYTCGAWAPGASPRHLALGRTDGGVVVWDVARGEIVVPLGGAPGGPCRSR
jgi:WD40 repeat protein